MYSLRILPSIKIILYTFPLKTYNFFFPKNPDMVDVLLVHKKSRYGCCPAGIFNNPNMVDVLLVHNSPDMVVFLLEYLKVQIWLMPY